MASLQRRLLGIWQVIVLAVGLIARSDDHPSNQRAVQPADLQYIVRSPDIGFEGLQWEAVADAYDRLRGQMEDRVDLVFIDGSLERPDLLNRPGDNGRVPVIPAAEELRSRIAVPNQRGHIGTPQEQLSY